MRLRRTAAAVLGALALLVTLPTSAHADHGYIAYKYGDPLFPNQAKSGQYPDNLEIPDDQCIEVPEVEGKPLQTAWAPDNHSQSDIFVFTEPECFGVKTRVRIGQKLGNLVLFKSFIQPSA
ncbi:hypothetical protein ACFY2K_10875 [Kitasatospora sp. NPDC001309]|uniref:hypothetical protein n=1 Tax=Kitasatospora sp. NPDC001309 TaxID=3364013 RepID=UPI0036964B6C